MTDDSKKPNANSDLDPRLSTFLRKAGAVIASERGLNSRSRMLLQALADQMSLPEALFEQGLVQLQDRQTVTDGVGRWEKAFLKFLDKEFEKMPSGILSIAMENRAVDLAERKYQINDARAQQLIQVKADEKGIGRVPPEEAARYVKQGIVDRMSGLVKVDDGLREKLYKIGYRWGIARDEVDAIILQTIRFNRKRNSKLLPIVCSILFAVAMTIGTIGYYQGWFARSNDLVNDLPLPDPDKIGDSEAPSIWNEETGNSLQKLSVQNAELAGFLKTIDNKSPLQRRVGIRSLVHRICSPDKPQGSIFQDAFAILFYEEMEQVVTQSAIDSASGYFFDQRTRPLSIRECEAMYLANRLVATTWFHPASSRTDNNPKRLMIQRLVRKLLDLEIDSVTEQQYVEISEGQIANDQWNKLLQTGWAFPGQSANLMEPLFELTRSRLSPASLNSLRHRALLAILQADFTRWIDLKETIALAVEASDELKLIQWIQLFESTSDRSFASFLGQALAAKTGVEAESATLSHVREALAKYRWDFQTRMLKPVISRNDFAAKIHEMMTASVEGPLQQSKPDDIAGISRATNLNLAFLFGIRDGQENFQAFDELRSKPLVQLRDLISIPSEQGTNAVRVAAIPTASENREKTTSLKKLESLAPNQTSARINALTKLARIAERFKDVSYQEASVLAEYLLSDLDQKQWLTVERNVTSFRHWNQLLLAISDQLPRSEISFENALEIAGLIFGKQFESVDKSQLQREIFLATQSQMNRILTEAPTADEFDWDRLKVYLDRTIARRFELVAPRFDQDLNQEDGNSIALNESMILMFGQAIDFPRLQQVRQALRLNHKLDNAPMQHWVETNQILVELLAQYLQQSWPEKKDAFVQIFHEYSAMTGPRQTLAERLLMTEWALLKLTSFWREIEMERLLDQ